MAASLENWASGNWMVKQGMEEEFIKRWKDWLGWSSENIAGFVSATLIRDTQNPRHFVSFSPWESDKARNEWKSSGVFQEKLALVRELCDDFQGSDYSLAAAFSAK